VLVVGFWSDWDYLNAVIESALVDVDPLSVTVIDPSPVQALEQKAPGLWRIAHAENVTFAHVPASAADALDELRQAFSLSYVRQVLAAGRAIFEEESGRPCDPSWLDAGGLNSEALYDWRRDAEGVPRTRPATLCKPTNPEALGFFHLRLRRAGAVPQAGGYELNGRAIRVVNGAGIVLSSMRAMFVEPPSAFAPEVVVAVGAVDLGVPANVVRSGRVDDIIRPGAGGKWLDLSSALEELEI
jgi:hypothetical protein